MADRIGDAIEWRSATHRLDVLEERSRGALADPNWRPWRASQMQLFKVTEIGPDGKPTGVVFDTTRKPEPKPVTRTPLTVDQRERVKRMREAGITVVGAA